MFRTIIWMATVGFWCAGAQADFVAYNDFGGTSPGNVTAISLSQSGLLKDFSTGANTPVTLNVVNGSPASATDGATGASPTGGDAFNIFNGKVNMAGYIWYNNVITVPYSNCRLDFTGLDPNKTYEIVLSANRDNAPYVARNTQFVISDVGAFTNNHSSGTVTYTTTTTNDSVKFNTGYNTLNGYVARWTLTSGPDGDFSVNVTAAPASGNANDDGRWYLGAMRLTEASTSYNFQNGVNGYTGTVDTYLQQINPNTNLGSTTPLKWDSEDGGGVDYALIRFDNIFGTGAGQIQPTDTIVSATLYYNVGGDANATGNNATVHEALVNWAETDTFNTFGGEADVQADEYGPSLGTAAGGTLGQASVNVTSSITAWKSNPSANHGWIFRPTGTDGTQVTSREDATVALRPRLAVVLIPGAPSGTTLTLQDGLNGYTDTLDTFLQQAAPTTNNGSVSPFKWDGEDAGGVDYALIRFNNLFGTGTNQIKSTDVITSATLVLTVSDAGNTGTIHEALVSWAESDTFNTFGGEPDVQADEYGPALGSISGAALGTQTVDVTSSLAAWQANGSPNTANLGWMIRPTGTDGVQIRSREYATTPSERPKLVVVLNNGVPVLKTLQVKHEPYLQIGNAPLVSTGAGIGTTDQIVIAWQTVESGSGSSPNDYFEVEYRPVGAGSYIPVSPISTLDVAIETRVNRSVTITGLPYDSDFEYRVHHKRNPSSPVLVTTYNGTFHTRKHPSSTASFSFAAYGDSANMYSAGEQANFQSVANRINSLQSAFVVLLGDNIYTAGTHPELDARLSASLASNNSAYIRNHVEYWCNGNHDAGTDGGLPSIQDYYCPFVIQGVTSPVAPAIGEVQEDNYSFDYGLVHFTIFDSCAWGDPGSSVSRQSAILNWMAADLAASTQPWKIVACHHPPKSYFSHSDAPGGMACEVFPVLIANGVDLLLVGHSHDYQRSFPITGHSGVPGCTGGDVTWIADQSGAYTKGAQTIEVVAGTGGENIDGPAPTTATQWVARAFGNNNGGVNGPFIIDVSAAQLVCKYTSAADGSIKDQFTISSPAPTIAVNPASFARSVFIGNSPSNDTFTVKNAGTGTITYSIDDDAAWLSVLPVSGDSSGESDTITVTYDTAALGYGPHNATITITSPEAINSPKFLPVTVTVQSVRPDFDFDGDVDQSDFAFLQNCFTGPVVSAVGDCVRADINITPDTHVDSGDLTIFLGCMSGADVPATANCAG